MERIYHLTKDMIKVSIDSRPINAFADCHNWCMENCTGKWTASATIVFFELEQDAIFYKLTQTT